MSRKIPLLRRQFLKQAAGVGGAATQVSNWPALAKENQAEKPEGEPQREDRRNSEHSRPDISYPRTFRGSQLKMISFPLGGVAAGSLGLGGRGQLIDWEMFNRPNKGFRPLYAFPTIWAQAEGGKPVARVLESRILPP